MALTTNLGFQAAASAAAYGQLALVELQLRSGTLRLTNWPLSITAQGQNWVGVGSLGSVGDLHESEDGASEKLTLTLSPVDVGTRALALGDPAEYQDRRVRVWIALLDAQTLQISGAPVLRFVGVMDKMRIERDETNATIEMECRTASYDFRSNPAALRMNHSQHQARHPGELGFAYLQNLIGNPSIWVGLVLQTWLKFRAILKSGA